MVRKIAENGSAWHEAPYTEEEERELRRRLNCPPVPVMHGQRTIVFRPPTPPKNDPQSDDPGSQDPTPAK